MKEFFLAICFILMAVMALVLHLLVKITDHLETIIRILEVKP